MKDTTGATNNANMSQETRRPRTALVSNLASPTPAALASLLFPEFTSPDMVQGACSGTLLESAPILRRL